VVTLNLRCFWRSQETSLNIKKNLNSDTFAETLWSLARHSPYAQSQKSYQDFCQKILIQQENFEKVVFDALFTFEVKDKIIAFLMVHIIYETIEIDFIYVHESYRRQFIGQKLFEALQTKVNEDFKESSKYKYILEVSEQNTAAQNFYKKLGFSAIGNRPKYYKNTEDAVIMEKI